MTNLIERLEAATGADRDANAALLRYLGWRRLGGSVFTPAGDRALTIPDYTASLDASLALVGEKLPGAAVIIGWNQTPETVPWARIGKPEDGADSTAPTPALAVLIALLKALGDQHD